MLKKYVVTTKIPQVSITSTLATPIHQIFLYDSRENIISKNSPSVGTVIDDTNQEYDLYYPDNKIKREMLYANCNSRNALSKNKVSCNYPQNFPTWNKVLQNYSILPDSRWYTTSHAGTFRAVLGPFEIHSMNYGERRLLLMGELHYSARAQCVEQMNTNGRGKEIQNITKDPYFLSNFIYQLAYSTQETIDVFLEAPITTEESHNKSYFVPHILQQWLPVTARRTRQMKNSNYVPTLGALYNKKLFGASNSTAVAEGLHNLRVHGTDVRFRYDPVYKILYTEYDLYHAVIYYFFRNENVNDFYESLKKIYPFTMRGLKVVIDNNIQLIEIIRDYCEGYFDKLKSQKTIDKYIDDFIEKFFVLEKKLIQKTDPYITFPIKNSLSKQLKKLRKTNRDDSNRLMHYFAVFYKNKCADIFKAYYKAQKFVNWLLEFNKNNVGNGNMDNNKNKNKIKQMYKSFVKKIKYSMAHYKPKGNEIDSFNEPDISFFAFLVDTYTIARILRTFEPSAANKKEKYSMNRPMNALLYFGNAHTQNVRVFIHLFNPNIALEYQKITTKNVEKIRKEYEKDMLYWENDYSTQWWRMMGDPNIQKEFDYRHIPSLYLHAGVHMMRIIDEVIQASNGDNNNDKKNIVKIRQLREKVLDRCLPEWIIGASNPTNMNKGVFVEKQLERAIKIFQNELSTFREIDFPLNVIYLEIWKYLLEHPDVKDKDVISTIQQLRKLSIDMTEIQTAEQNVIKIAAEFQTVVLDWIEKNKNKTSGKMKREMDYVENMLRDNWPLMQCKRLTKSKMHQPFIVRDESNFLIGIKK
jgi:hypothetical protein